MFPGEVINDFRPLINPFTEDTAIHRRGAWIVSGEELEEVSLYEVYVHHMGSAIVGLTLTHSLTPNPPSSMIMKSMAMATPTKFASTTNTTLPPPFAFPKAASVPSSGGGPTLSPATGGLC